MTAKRRKRTPHSVDDAEIKENAKARFPDDEQSQQQLYTFSVTLNNLLETRGIDQVTMAKELNISTGRLSNYRNAKQEPSLTAIIRIAEYLNVDCHYLMTGVSSWASETNQTLGLSDAAIKTLRFIQNAPEGISKQVRDFNSKTLMMINHILGYENKKIFIGPFGPDDVIFKNVLSEMYDYIYMNETKIKYIGEDDGSIPEDFNVRDLLREMHIANIRKQLDWYIEEEKK